MSFCNRYFLPKLLIIVGFWVMTTSVTNLAIGGKYRLHIQGLKAAEQETSAQQVAT
jgi:hypothetical protein